MLELIGVNFNTRTCIEHQQIKFQHDVAERGRVIGDLANFTGSFNWWLYPNTEFSESGAPNYAKFGENIGESSELPTHVLLNYITHAI